MTTLLVLAGAALGGYGLYLVAGYIAEKRQAAPRPQPVVPRVRALRLESRDVPIVEESTGFLTAAATVRVPVETQGKLLAKHVREGDAVKRGDLVAEVDGAVHRMRVDACEARGASLRAQLEYLEKELQREEELVRLGSGKPAELDRWRAEKRRLDAALLENAAERAQANLLLERSRVHADRDGIWYEDLAEEGEYMTPGQPLGLLRDVSTLELEVEVPAHVRLGLDVGRSVKVHLLDGEPGVGRAPRIPSACRIVRLPPGAGASRRFPVVVEIPNESGALVPGLFARVELELPRPEPLLLVPKECVFELYGRNAVYVLERDGDFHQAALTFLRVRGARDLPESWVVLDGVEQGDEVIVSPLEALVDGLRVEPERGP